MRVALFSDVHGNSIALDAVLSDIAASGGVDEYWALGDLVALGPDPVGVVERLVALPSLSVLRGNTDRYVVTGERPPPSLAEAAADPELVRVIMEVAGSFAWTAGYMAAAGLTDWLDALPARFTRTLPDGTRVLAVHAVAAFRRRIGYRSAGDRRRAGRPARRLRRRHRVRGAHASSRRPAHRFDPGRQPRQREQSGRSRPAASYVMLDADAGGYRIEHRRVEYDREAVIASVEALNHPGRGYIVKHHRGEVF